MADYADLDDLVSALKVAAIDAYMSGFHHYGDQYRQVSPSALLPGFYLVTRPRRDGSGGGEYTSQGRVQVTEDQKEDFTKAFEAIRRRIETAMEPWYHLPDPADILDNVNLCRQVTQALSGAASTTADQVTGAGVLDSNISLVMQNTTAMAGRAIASFKATCLSRLGPTIGGLHAISIVQGGALAAEYGLWRGARTTLVDIIRLVTARLNTIFESASAPNWNAILLVAGWASEGLTFFAGGPAKTALEVTGLGIQILSETTKKKDVGGPADNVDVALAGFEAALTKLNKQIGVEEKLLRDNLTQNTTYIRRDLKPFDLTTDPITAEEVTHDGVISIDFGLADEITSTYLPNIVAELNRIAPIDLSASMNGVRRDASLGIGPLGPLPEWNILNVLLHDLIVGLATDVERSSENLRLAVADFLHLESDTSADLDRSALAVQNDR